MGGGTASRESKGRGPQPQYTQRLLSEPPEEGPEMNGREPQEPDSALPQMVGTTNGKSWPQPPACRPPQPGDKIDSRWGVTVHLFESHTGPGLNVTDPRHIPNPMPGGLRQGSCFF